MDRGLSTIPLDELATLSMDDWGKLTDAFIILVNPKGMVTQTSQNSLAYLGIEQENLRGTRLQDLEFGVGANLKSMQTQHMLDKIESELVVDSYPISLSDCNGNECKLMFHGRHLQSKNDEAGQVLLVGRDAKSNAFSTSRGSGELPVEKIQLLCDVAGQSAHRFNNLLTAFSCQISILEDMSSDNDQLENVQQELTKIFGQFKKQSHDLSRACAEIKS